MRTAAILATALSAAFSIQAAELQVPADYETIQAALDAAQAGDAVVIAPGTYTGSLQMPRDGVTLQGAGPDEVVVVSDVVSDGPALVVNQRKNCTITGITFAHAGSADSDQAGEAPGAVVVSDSSECLLEDIVVEKGPGHGLLIMGASKPIFRRVVARKNKEDGFHITGEKTEATLEEARAEDNGRNGVRVEEEATAAIKGLVAHGNGKAGFSPEDGCTITAENYDITKNGLIGNDEMAWLLHVRDFDTIEARAKAARAKRMMRAEGYPDCLTIYQGLANGWAETRRKNKEDFLEVHAAWSTAYPQSVTAATSLLGAYKEYAWDERGGGWASSVTPEGWQGFYAYLDKAWALYSKARKFEEKDVELHSRAVTIARGLGDDMAMVEKLAIATGWKGYKTRAEKAFEEGFVLDPNYYPLYTDMTANLLPRWGGSRAEIVSFAEKSAERIGGDEGEIVYAVVAISACDWEAEELKDYAFDWDRLQRALDIWKSKVQDPRYVENVMAYMACMLDDKEVAAASLKRLGTDWDLFKKPVWNRERTYQAYRAWAIENAEKPVSSTPLLSAADYNRIEEAEVLLAEGADPNQANHYGTTPLKQAIRSDHREMIELLLQKGADPNTLYREKGTVLYRAVYDGNETLVRLLLDHGADPNTTYESLTAVAQAVAKGHRSIAELLLDRGADPNQLAENNSTLHRLIQFGSEGDLRMLLERGADPNLRTTDNWPALDYAFSKENYAAASLLLEYGADPNQPGAHADWPLSRQLIWKQVPIEFLEKALAKGADFNYAKPGYQAPIYDAVIQDSTDMLAFLIEKAGVDPNLCDDEKKVTALHFASGKGKAQAVAYLLAHGADPAAKTAAGKTALDIAREKGHKEIAAMLKSPMKEAQP